MLFSWSAANATRDTWGTWHPKWQNQQTNPCLTLLLILALCTQGAFIAPARAIAAEKLTAESAQEAVPAAATETITDHAASLPSLHFNDLTWSEIQGFLDASQGKNRVLVPTAGTEQNGHHLPLGKHRIVITHTAEKIAQQLGNTLIAPIIDTVPEHGHMAYPGTISMEPETFFNILRDTGESLAAHGFSHIYFMGDSGGNQEIQAMIAKELRKKYRQADIHFYSLHNYYAENGQHAWLNGRGYESDRIGTHAGIRDTSEVMAIAPEAVRTDKLAAHHYGDSSGADGDSTLASPGIGKKMLTLKINAAIKEIRELESAQ